MSKICSHTRNTILSTLIGYKPLVVCVRGNRYSWSAPNWCDTKKKKLLLVATNYFSKWVEVEAYASIKDKYVFKFV